MNKRLLLAIMITGIALRVIQIWTPPLWYDENYSLILARLPFDQMWAAMLTDVHPPLWYLVLWPLGQIPDAPAWIIRIPALLFSIGSLWLFWRVMDNMIGNQTVKYTVLVIMAIAPIQIYYAQEGRMYAMLLFFVLAAWLCIYERRWVFLIAALIGILYTQNVGVLYVACLGAAGMITYWGVRRSLRSMLIAFGIAGFAWLAWVPVMFNQMGLIDNIYWIPPVTLGGALYHYAQMFWIANLAIRLEIITAIVFFMWLILALYYMFRTYRHPFRWELVILAFGPWLLEIAISFIFQPILLHRTLIGVTPFLYIILGSFVLRLTELKTRMISLAIMVPLILCWYAHYEIKLIYPDNYGYPAYLLQIEPNWKPGDILYHASDNTIIDTWAYTSVPKHDIYKMQNCAPIIGGLSSHTREAMGFHQALLDDLDWTRAWIITAETPFNPICETEYISRYISNRQPIRCIGNNYIQTCLYLVEQ